jgi:hypothetical protein
MATVYTLEIDAGATFTRQFEYLNDDGTPFDLEGFSALFQIRLKPDTELILETVPTIDLDTATVSLVLTAEETALLTEPDYVYGLELIHESGEPVIRLVGGTCLISPEVVRPEGS